jgi:hypothetical protein
MRISLEGEEKLQAFLKTRPDRAVTALAGALLVEGEQIMKRSKDEFVPIDIGTLEASGFVDMPEREGETGVSVTLGYGGAAAAYALIQHERTDFHHPGQGQAKYLEQPMLEAHKGMGERTARRIKRRLERP